MRCRMGIKTKMLLTEGVKMSWPKTQVIYFYSEVTTVCASAEFFSNSGNWDTHYKYINNTMH